MVVQILTLALRRQREVESGEAGLQVLGQQGVHIKIMSQKHTNKPKLKPKMLRLLSWVQL